MTKRPKRRTHGRREQAKALRRKKIARVKRVRAEAARLFKRAQENVAAQHRENARREIMAELHEPRVMSEETRNLRRGRRAAS